MRCTSILLALSLLAPATAHAAPPAPTAAALPVAGGDLRPDEQERVELERETKLDLSKPWQAYSARRRDGNFYQFVEKDFRRKRNIGRGVTMAGLGGILIGATFFSLGVPRPGYQMPMTVTGEVIMGVGAVTAIVGGIVWGIWFRKIDRLEVSEDRAISIGPRGRLRLQSLSPAGLRLAF